MSFLDEPQGHHQDASRALTSETTNDGPSGTADPLDDLLLLRVAERLKRKLRARYVGIALGRMR
jgi:hypothetical protein